MIGIVACARGNTRINMIDSPRLDDHTGFRRPRSIFARVGGTILGRNRLAPNLDLPTTSSWKILYTNKRKEGQTVHKCAVIDKLGEKERDRWTNRYSDYLNNKNINMHSE